MAFTATVSHIGGRDILVTITETNVSSSSEATITGLPKKGILLSQLADKTAGSAATIDPRVTTASGSTLAVQTVIENDTAAASISNLASPPIPYYSADGKLYVKSGANAGSDNSITTVLLIRAGW